MVRTIWNILIILASLIVLAVGIFANINLVSAGAPWWQFVMVNIVWLFIVTLFGIGLKKRFFTKKQ